MEWRELGSGKQRDGRHLSDVQKTINYNFFDRAHCRTDRTIAILCVSWSDKMQFYIGDNLLALHNYPRQLRSHHSSSEPFTSVQRYRYIALYTT